jgi:plasmid replication initiation protein
METKRPKVTGRTKELKLVGTELVVQDNRLVDSPRMLTLQEQKLFLFLVSKLDPFKQEDVILRIPIVEFAKAIGVDSQNDIYRDVNNIVKRLMSRVASINCVKEDGGRTTKNVHFISYAEYWHGKGYADIKISDEIIPYLFGLKSEYTQYKLSQVATLSSVYAIRIYEMLKKQEKFGCRAFFIDDLREKLGIKKEQYKRFSDFKQYVLDIAKREINEKTDIMIDYKFIKTGRKFTAAQFSVKPKNEKKAEKQPKFLETYNSAPDSKYVYELMEYGFTRNSANRLLYNLQSFDIENAISAVKESIQKGKCKSPKAMLRTALKECWTPSSSANKTLERRGKTETTIKDVPGEELLETDKSEAIVRQKKSFGFFGFLNKMLNK